MRETVALRQQLRDSIEQEILERTRVHQQKIARVRSAMAGLMAAGAAAPAMPLVMLAHGDSWFDYPLSGNDPSFSSTDIIAQLQGMGNIIPMILNVSHHGDATTDEMSLPKQERMITALQNPANWLGEGKPDAILFSGGGDDIVGDQFCIYLNYATPGASGLNTTRFQKALGNVEGSYLDLFAFRDRYAPGVPIFGHCYDIAIPNGTHPVCAGPWLKPSLDFCGWNLTQGTGIVQSALVDFKSLLVGLAGNAANNFTLINTQGTLTASDWANELHPYPSGFKELAGKFVDALRVAFPGRI